MIIPVLFLLFIFFLQIPGNMQGFNWYNQSERLPPAEIMPPVLKGQMDPNGIQYYTVTGK